MGRSSYQHPDLHKNRLTGVGQGERGEENSATNALGQWSLNHLTVDIYLFINYIDVSISRNISMHNKDHR